MSSTIEILAQREQKKQDKVNLMAKARASRKTFGRPVGSKNGVTLLKEAILQQAEEKVLQEFMQIVQTTIDLANKGDTSCLKILWDRIIPSKRAIDVTHTGNEKLQVVINVSGMETKGVQDISMTTLKSCAIIDGEIVEDA
jgi:hypothetical protein